MRRTTLVSSQIQKQRKNIYIYIKNKDRGTVWAPNLPPMDPEDLQKCHICNLFQALNSTTE